MVERKNRTKIITGLVILAIAIYLLIPYVNTLSIKSQFPVQASHNSIDIQTIGKDVIIKDVFLNNNVFGVSMIPTIFPGNTLIIRKFEGEDLKEGTIVVAKIDDVLIAHRVIAFYPPDTIIIMGDNSNRIDNIKKENVLGIVVGVLYD